MKSDKIISVIVPVYNMEKHITKCLKSLSIQSHSNLEIIVVNDASTDRSIEIIKEFVNADSRIKVVNHSENRGLFQARLTGAGESTGDYIAFVDSDDSVGIDWFRVLERELRESEADMVVGNTINVDEGQWHYQYNFYKSLTKNRGVLKDSEPWNAYWEQEGLCFLWHTVWNKLYTRELWKKCEVHYSKIKPHLIMAEDMAFSTVLYYYCKKMVFTNHDGYFYYRHSEASTTVIQPKEKYLKHVEDLSTVFTFISDFLAQVGENKILNGKYRNLSDRYFRIWSSNIIAAGFAQDEEICENIMKVFNKSKLEGTRENDFVFYSMVGGWDGKYENIKNCICQPELEYISFDVFDTLLKRPFLKPTDLFAVVDLYCVKNSLLTEYGRFTSMRGYSEEFCRAKTAFDKPSVADVTIYEIYEAMENIYKLSHETISDIMELELQLEYRFIEKRKAGWELFQLAKETGKKIILISDMYLPSDIIERMLEKCGISGYEKLYVSCDIGHIKRDGQLFTFALKELQVKDNKNVLHIGDDWQADVVEAQKAGMQSLFFPKASEVYFNKISDIYTGACSAPYRDLLGMWFNPSEASENLLIKCILGAAVNEMFDMPFQSFEQNSDFNGDAFLIGYYALGMHMFAVSKWLLEDSIETGCGKIHFLARDGYLPMKAYTILKELYPDAPKVAYFHGTRKALIKYSIRSQTDLFSIMDSIDYRRQTPAMVLDLLKDILKPLDDLAKREYRERGVLLEKKFESVHEFHCFIQTVIELSYDQSILDRVREEFIQGIAGEFSEGDATFDIGYSGRLQNILMQITGKNMDAYYIHQSSKLQKVSERYGCKVKNFYEDKPCISGIIREYFISDYRASCVGYEKTKDGLMPVFEKENEVGYDQAYAIEEMFRGALAFMEKVKTVFGAEIPLLSCSHVEASAAFEYYLFQSKEYDRKIISGVTVEDMVYEGYQDKKLKDIWEWNINHYGYHRQTVVMKQETELGDELRYLYKDGLFVSFYNTMNKLFPLGSKRREGIKWTVKKIARK